MTSTLGPRLRQHMHHGSVVASGFLWREVVDIDLRASVSAAWRPGAVVLRVPDGYVMLLRQTIRVAAELGIAAPLVDQQGCLTSAPLSSPELAACRGRGDLLLVMDGQPRSFHCAQLERVDPSAWLDVSDFTLLPARPLGHTTQPQMRLPPCPVQTPLSMLKRDAAREIVRGNKNCSRR